MTSSIRVLVVDDSALVRRILTKALSNDPGIEIVGTARNGVEALEKAADLRPDVITLDIEMPELDGFGVLRHLPKRSDARVVVLSSLTDAAAAYPALLLGAIDFVQKPTAGVATSIAELSAEMSAKIRTAFHVDPGHAAEIALQQRALSRGTASPSAPAEGAAGASIEGPGIAVGFAASTGGPPALEQVLSGLSPTLGAAFIVVQHLPAGFSASMARRLSSHTSIEFVEAEQGMPVEAGCGYIAPHGAHLLVIDKDQGGSRFSLLREPPINGVTSSADPLFTSLATRFGSQSIGVVLTGMGADAAAGAAAIKQVGGEIIVQDEATSVVWGMPRAAQRAGAVKRAYPLESIADRVRQAIHARRRGASA